MNSFQRKEAVRELRRVALARGWFMAHDFAAMLGVSKRRALYLLAAGRVPGATRDGGPRLRVKDKRRGRRRVWRV